MTDLHLRGRTALVTGGTRGLGKATVRALADTGADVAFTFRNSQDAADDLVDELATSGTRIRGFQANQAHTAETEGLVSAVMSSFGRLDVVVVNASIDAYGPIDDPDRDDAKFDEFWAVSLFGFMAVVRAASKVITDGGRIIMIGSPLGVRPGMAGTADNAASKSAIDGFARGVARDLGPRGVTVNVVHCGPMETDLTEGSREMLQPLIDGLCLPRFATVEEVSATICFLTSPAADFITGQTIGVNGGYNA